MHSISVSLQSASLPCYFQTYRQHDLQHLDINAEPNLESTHAENRQKITYGGNFYLYLDVMKFIIVY